MANKNRSIKRVAVIDDDEDAAETVISALVDGKFEAFRQKAHENISDLINDVIANSDAAVCDHRLRYGAFADIEGADLASRLIQRSHPTILVTQYLDQDAGIAIRRYRRNLPVVLRREDADEPEELRSAFARCIIEMSNGRQEDRTPQKTLLSVSDLVEVDGDWVVDAVVNGWNSKSAVRFPLSLVRSEDRDSVAKGARLIAVTNLRAESQTDLYFEDVQLAPAIDEHDGLE